MNQLNIPANIDLFKINNDVVLVFLLLTYFTLLLLTNFTPFSSVFIVDFEQVNVS